MEVPQANYCCRAQQRRQDRSAQENGTHTLAGARCTYILHHQSSSEEAVTTKCWRYSPCSTSGVRAVGTRSLFYLSLSRTRKVGSLLPRPPSRLNWLSKLLARCI